MAKQAIYRAFLLTAWTEPRTDIERDVDSICHWRFGLEDARGSKQRRVFNTLQEMLQHIIAELGKEE